MLFLSGRRLPRRALASNILTAIKPTPSLASFGARRQLSSVTRSTSRISTVLGVLLTVGLATTAFGLYEFYSLFTLWPEEVRSDLRAAVKAKHRGDLDLSERYFRRAWEVTQTMAPSKFGSAPYLKITGILIALVDILESNQNSQLAYDLMSRYLINLPPRDSEASAPTWSGPERMRLVAIAHKLAEMAEMHLRPASEVEHWLVWSVTELIVTLRNASKHGHAELAPVSQELQLPDWLIKIDAAAPLEALGQYYSSTGKVELAIPLYLQALNILVPGDVPEKATETNLCHAAQVMSNIGEMFTRPSSSPETAEEGNQRLNQAENWAENAVNTTLQILTKSKEEHSGSQSICKEGFSIYLANLGTIKMMRGEISPARQLFELSLKHAVDMGYRSQVTEVRRLLEEAEAAPNK